MSTFQLRVYLAAARRSAMNWRRRLLSRGIASIAIAAASQHWKHFWMEQFEAEFRSSQTIGGPELV